MGGCVLLAASCAMPALVPEQTGLRRFMLKRARPFIMGLAMGLAAELSAKADGSSGLAA